MHYDIIMEYILSSLYSLILLHFSPSKCCYRSLLQGEFRCWKIDPKFYFSGSLYHQCFFHYYVRLSVIVSSGHGQGS